MRVGSSYGGQQDLLDVNAPSNFTGEYIQEFTATTATSYVTARGSPTTDADIQIESVSVKEAQVFTLEGNASVFQPPVDASGPFGYLAEKASTNLVLQSEDFTSGWANSFSL